jgi:hypothetical protein
MAPTVFRARPKHPPPLRNVPDTTHDERMVLSGSSSVVTTNVQDTASPVTKKGKGSFTFNSEANDGGLFLQKVVDGHKDFTFHIDSDVSWPPEVRTSGSTIDGPASSGTKMGKAPISDFPMERLPKNSHTRVVTSSSIKPMVNLIDFGDSSVMTPSSGNTTNVTPSSTKSVIKFADNDNVPTKDILGVIEIKLIGAADSRSSIYVERNLVHQALDMIKEAAVKPDELNDHNEYYLLKGSFLNKNHE